MSLGYTIALEPDDNETWLVRCPALPRVLTYGETRDAALGHAMEAIEVALASLIDDGLDLPPLESGSRNLVILPALSRLKIELYRTLRAAGLTRADLVRRLGWHREQVDRLFRIGHASKIEQIEAAFRAIGKEVDVGVREVA